MTTTRASTSTATSGPCGRSCSYAPSSTSSRRAWSSSAAVTASRGRRSARSWASAARPRCAATRTPRGARWPARSDVEADVQDVAVLDHVGLPLEALLPAPRRLGVRAGVEQVVPAHDLAADESARDVRVDRLGGLERRLPATQRPGARLL